MDSRVAGSPTPNNVVQARLPASGIQVTTYIYMRFFSVPEGDLLVHDDFLVGQDATGGEVELDRHQWATTGYS